MEEKNEKPESPLQESAIPLGISRAAEEPPSPKKKGRGCCKCFKIICCILLLIVVLLIGAFLFFIFYIFKRRAVEVSTSNTELESLSYTIFPIITLNLVMGVNIGVKNPNYAGFKYQSTNTTLFYHGTAVGISPMPADVVKARSSKKIHSTIYINATTMISSPSLYLEMLGGKIPLSSRTYMVGKATIFNTFELKATVSTTCDISVNLQSSNTSATCSGRVKVL
jgi:Late embryogenesis abundant protein